ncbi:30S ribosomal protein S12 methylthiotransferase RimO [Collinsella sp. AGMB00827]|uniref:Ribosomal protein uS12 methylthiotransferase RimO n=1 Tax=Collinsella ureilytica TaxID=2869515 RepID=A0ABS7MKT8_9ACTN|nr:30S ribosomal protein S12 methylthiotransferase RimO [Collinsella urealyticum]MBY4797985.1 30S ribosomal protein S12 methylthiotransferase RimO [Collinsella urealyticum]
MSLARLHYITLGCAKNEVDTDRMRSLLTAAGYDETPDVGAADAVLINTCSFLASATSESIEMTLEIAQGQAGELRSSKIIMCGCVPSRYGADLPSELPEVAAFVRTDEEDGIVSVLDQVLDVKRTAPGHIPAVKRTVEGSVAYLKISDGCDRYCSFCAIPYIRGRYHSRAAADIVAEASELVAGGVRELVLIGQDTGVWGQDLDPHAPGPHDLAGLLRAVAACVRPHKVWIRVLYLQPEGMSEDLIHTIRDTPEILPYIDIPVQHVNETILRRMRRQGSRAELDQLFAHLRHEIPHMVIRTTYLSGFPGETEADAEEMLSFMADTGFDYTSVFAYSQEEGTRAAALPDQLDEATKLERAQAGMDLAEELGFASTAARVGTVADVLVDGIDEDGELIGHAWFQAPDSDGAVHLHPGSARPGEIVPVLFTDSFCYELIGMVEGREAS